MSEYIILGRFYCILTVSFSLLALCYSSRSPQVNNWGLRLRLSAGLQETEQHSLPWYPAIASASVASAVSLSTETETFRSYVHMKVANYPYITSNIMSVFPSSIRMTQDGIIGIAMAHCITVLYICQLHYSSGNTMVYLWQLPWRNKLLLL